MPLYWFFDFSGDVCAAGTEGKGKRPLLTEQRTATIIDLLEELRRDMPSVHNRLDLEAEALIKTVDPHAVLATFESKLEETLQTERPSDEAARLVTEQMDAAAAETQEEIAQAKREAEEKP